MEKAAQSAYAATLPFKATAPERTFVSTPAVRELRSVRNHIGMYMEISCMCYVTYNKKKLERCTARWKTLSPNGYFAVISLDLFVSIHTYCRYKSIAAIDITLYSHK
jgi:hypothetical protein